MKLNRQLIQVILEAAAVAYPDRERKFLSADHPDYADDDKISHALYLQEHGLLDAGLTQFMSGNYARRGMQITAAGIDFLEADGGLSALLGVVTIKFQEEDLLALMGSRIESSSLPPPEKKKLLDGLRSLPAESIKHLTMKLLDKGLENLPAALPVIQTYLLALLK